MRRLRTTSLALLFWCALFVLLGEWTLRRFAPQDLRPAMFTIDPDYHHGLIPNQTARHRNADFDVTYHINAAGYRGPLYPVAKPANTLRVVALGDSFCFGHGVNDDQTFPYVLEANLRNALHRPVQVFNFGVMGWGTSNELRKLEKEGLSYQPDVVVLAFFSNDPEDDANYRLYTLKNGRMVTHLHRSELTGYKRLIDRLPGYDWLVSHSELAALLRETVWRSGPAHQDVHAAGPEITSGNLALTAAEFDRFRELSDRYHFQFVTMIVGSAGMSERPGTPDAFVRSYCLTHGLPLVDTAQWLAAYAARAHVSPHSAWYPHDGHWKPWMQRRAAALLAENIERLPVPSAATQSLLVTRAVKGPAASPAVPARATRAPGASE